MCSGIIPTWSPGCKKKAESARADLGDDSKSGREPGDEPWANSGVGPFFRLHRKNGKNSGNFPDIWCAS